MTRVDPWHVFRFVMEVDHVERGGFLRVKGLMRETKFDSHREGGLNEFEHKLATQTTYGNLTLERGFADDFLWKWHNDVIAGDIKRRELAIVLQDSAGQRVWKWVVEAAYPVKWSGTDLDATSGQVLIESVELVHHGIHGARA